MTDLFELWYTDVQHRSAPYIRQFDNYLMMLRGFPPEACDQTGTCGIQYVVEADGSVYPCDFYVLDGYRLGNFNQDLMPAIDEARRQLGFVRASEDKPEECRSCEWYNLCRGGCRRGRYTAADVAVAGAAEAAGGPAGAGTLGMADPGCVEGLNYFCEGYKMFFEACGERLFELAQRG